MGRIETCRTCVCVSLKLVESNTAISAAVLSISRTKTGIDTINIGINMSVASCNSFGSTALTLSSHTCHLYLHLLSVHFYALQSLTNGQPDSLRCPPSISAALACSLTHAVHRLGSLRDLCDSLATRSKFPFRSSGADRNTQRAEVTLACLRIQT